MFTTRNKTLGHDNINRRGFVSDCDYIVLIFVTVIAKLVTDSDVRLCFFFK